MWLTELDLVSFRNFTRLRLTPRPGVLLFSGRNGQGKTNLLEAVYVLATTRSPRTSVERELLSWRTPEDAALAAVMAPFARLEARVRRLQTEVHLEVTFEADRVLGDGPSPVNAGGVTRGIKVNGLPTRATGLVGQLPVVYFSPGDVELAGGPPAGRRQYLNLANSQTSTEHMRALQRYNRVLLQRNQVLRFVRERRQPAAALDPWTEHMIALGALVLRGRLAMLRQVNERLISIFPDLAGSDETLQVAYRSTASDPGAEAYAASTDELTRSFRERQQQVAGREIDQAVSLVGPHRDDFAFILDGVDLNRYGSRGQQRLAVLALKLAEADWMHAEIGEAPVVLLDDVLSELDPQRRTYVLQRVAAPDPTMQHQVWITTTEPSALASVAGMGSDQQTHDFLSVAQAYLIDAGCVRTA
jgi:DNA replication and repair protein RecF